VSLVRVPKDRLLLLAGLVWCAAGAMVTAVGLPLEVRLSASNLALIPLGIAIFLAFYFLVFSRLVLRHTSRIRARPEARVPFWQFFNAPSWALMALMMGGGMGLRLSHVTPDWVIAFFYSGLGIALFVCGIRFLGNFARGDALASEPEPRRTDG
jgi:small-conductance mechanosensitive channel